MHKNPPKSKQYFLSLSFKGCFHAAWEEPNVNDAPFGQFTVYSTLVSYIFYYIREQLECLLSRELQCFPSNDTIIYSSSSTLIITQLLIYSANKEASSGEEGLDEVTVCQLNKMSFSCIATLLRIPSLLDTNTSPEFVFPIKSNRS
jgi:hypothetical protein